MVNVIHPYLSMEKTDQEAVGGIASGSKRPLLDPVSDHVSKHGRTFEEFMADNPRFVYHTPPQFVNSDELAKGKLALSSVQLIAKITAESSSLDQRTVASGFKFVSRLDYPRIQEAADHGHGLVMKAIIVGGPWDGQEVVKIAEVCSLCELNVLEGRTRNARMEDRLKKLFCDNDPNAMQELAKRFDAANPIRVSNDGWDAFNRGRVCTYVEYFERKAKTLHYEFLTRHEHVVYLYFSGKVSDEYPANLFGAIQHLYLMEYFQAAIGNNARVSEALNVSFIGLVTMYNPYSLHPKDMETVALRVADPAQRGALLGRIHRNSLDEISSGEDGDRWEEFETRIRERYYLLKDIYEAAEKSAETGGSSGLLPSVKLPVPSGGNYAYSVPMNRSEFADAQVALSYGCLDFFIREVHALGGVNVGDELKDLPKKAIVFSGYAAAHIRKGNIIPRPLALPLEVAYDAKLAAWKLKVEESVRERCFPFGGKIQFLKELAAGFLGTYGFGDLRRIRAGLRGFPVLKPCALFSDPVESIEELDGVGFDCVDYQVCTPQTYREARAMVVLLTVRLQRLYTKELEELRSIEYYTARQLPEVIRDFTVVYQGIAHALDCTRKCPMGLSPTNKFGIKAPADTEELKLALSEYIGDVRQTRVFGKKFDDVEWVDSLAFPQWRELAEAVYVHKTQLAKEMSKKH